jgi:hypothetical protein
MSCRAFSFASFLYSLTVGLAAFDAEGLDETARKVACNGDAEFDIGAAMKCIAETQLDRMPEVPAPMGAEFLRARPLSACEVWFSYERERCHRGQAALKAIEQFVDNRGFAGHLLDFFTGKEQLPFRINYDNQRARRSKWLRLLVGDNGFERVTKVDSYRQEVNDATLVQLSALTGLEELDLVNANFTDDGLAVLKPLKNLQRLYLSDRALTDRGIAQLSGPTGLRSLKEVDLLDTKVTGSGFAGLCQLEAIRISYSPITDEGLRAICGISGLQSLRLSETRITDDGLKELRRLSRLKFLSIGELSDDGISDAGIVYLRELQQLELLSLTSNRITDAAAADIAKLHRLKHLSILSDQVTDRALAGLAPMSALESLFLTSPMITDDGLEQLTRIKSLQHLDVFSPNVTRAGIEKLRESLPKLRLSNFHSPVGYEDRTNKTDDAEESSD